MCTLLGNINAYNIIVVVLLGDAYKFPGNIQVKNNINVEDLNKYAILPNICRVIIWKIKILITLISKGLITLKIMYLQYRDLYCYSCDTSTILCVSIIYIYLLLYIYIYKI